MGLTDKVSELANYFSNNFDKVKELPTSLAGSITSAATAVPKAPMFSQSSAKRAWHKHKSNQTNLLGLPSQSQAGTETFNPEGNRGWSCKNPRSGKQNNMLNINT